MAALPFQGTTTAASAAIAVVTIKLPRSLAHWVVAYVVVSRPGLPNADRTGVVVYTQDVMVHGANPASDRQSSSYMPENRFGQWHLQYPNLITSSSLEPWLVLCARASSTFPTCFPLCYTLALSGRPTRTSRSPLVLPVAGLGSGASETLFGCRRNSSLHPCTAAVSSMSVLLS